MNSNTNWVVRVDAGVYKTLKKAPSDYAKRIADVIERLPLDPYTGDIRKIKGEEGVWRRRIGAYRIFYELDALNRSIDVFRVERRTSKTY